MSATFERKGGPYVGSKLISTGLPGIDFLLGGGVAGGTIILIEESKRLNGFADAIAKLFMAEGLFQKNRIYFASDGTVPCSDFLQTIPQAVVNDPDGTALPQDAVQFSSPENMEIAFRYDHLPVKNVLVNNEFRRQPYRFDFTKPVSMDDLRSYKHLSTYDAYSEEGSSGVTSHYDAILVQLRHLLSNRDSDGSQDGARRHRVLIHQFGSPLWLASGSQSADSETVTFLSSLRALLRCNGKAVALITLTTAFVDDDSLLLRRIRHVADVVFRLDPMKVDDKEKSLLDYHGFFRCLRTPSINTISFPVPDCADYGFKLKRKEFLIERLHLPPDLSETVSRAQLDSFSCASASSRSKLDF